MKLLIIEPHADDTFLSANYILKDFFKVYDKSLLTITNSTVTGQYRDSQKYCKYKKIAYINDNNFVPQMFFKDAMKIAKDNTNIDLFSAFYDNSPEIYSCIYKRIDRILKQENPDIILTCFGLFHCTHVFTRHCIDSIVKEKQIFYFLDNPYFTLPEMNRYYNLPKPIFQRELSIKEQRTKANQFQKFYKSEVYMKDLYKTLFSEKESIF